MITIIQSIRDFIKTCPFLNENGLIHVDYLADEPIEYTIDSIPVNPIVKKFLDGSAIMQYAFVFASREVYGENVLQNMYNCGFYEEFARWLNQKTKLKELPALNKNQAAQKIEAVTTPYVFGTTTKEARYQIQCRLQYFQKGE